MLSIELKLETQDLDFFDKFLRKGLVRPPVDSLRSQGSYNPGSRAYQLTYRGHIGKDEKEFVFEMKLSATPKDVYPLDLTVELVSPRLETSEEEIESLLDLLVSRIRESEENAKKKPLKTFEYEARLSTSDNTLKSTIIFGKYKLVPIEKQEGMGRICKLKFSVEAIDKHDSLTNAIIEGKKIAAWLSLVLSKLTLLESFSEITVDPKPEVHFETVERPDLRPIKHSFGEELKIPHDFMELWNNFCSLPSEMYESFVSSCLCYQTAREMELTHAPVSCQLYVTAIEVIARKVVKGGPTERFVKFICQSLKRSEKQFRKILRGFYGRRSAFLHEKGIGLGIIPSFGIRSLEDIPVTELWQLEIIVNAALIGFLKNIRNFSSCMDNPC